MISKMGLRILSLSKVSCQIQLPLQILMFVGKGMKNLIFLESIRVGNLSGLVITIVINDKPRQLITNGGNLPTLMTKLRFHKSGKF